MSSLPGKKAERQLVDETAGVRFDAYENASVKIGKYDKRRSTIRLDCQCEIFNISSLIFKSTNCKNWAYRKYAKIRYAKLFTAFGSDRKYAKIRYAKLFTAFGSDSKFCRVYGKLVEHRFSL